MPYIITTKPRHYSDPHDRRGWDPRVLVSRRAVATLEEARAEAVAACISSEHDYAGDERWEPAYEPFEHQCEALPEAGGTSGPLPDGTVIEVEPIEWDQLALDAGLTYPAAVAKRASGRTQIIDAYNEGARA